MSERSSKSTNRKQNLKVLKVENSKSTVLSPKHFKDFCDFLRALEITINDLMIIDGVFRTRSNDHSFIIETTMPYFKGMDIILSDQRSLLKDLSIFDKKAHIKITTDNENVYFGDGFQQIRIPVASAVFSDNKFMTSEEVKQLFHNNFKSSQLMLKANLSKNIVSNINKMAWRLNAPTYYITHHPSDPNQPLIRVCKSINLAFKEYNPEMDSFFHIPIKKNHYTSLSADVFNFDKNDMILYLFESNKDDILIAIYNTCVGDLSVNVYARGAVINTLEEEEF